MAIRKISPYGFDPELVALCYIVRLALYSES